MQPDQSAPQNNSQPAANAQPIAVAPQPQVMPAMGAQQPVQPLGAPQAVQPGQTQQQPVNASKPNSTQAMLQITELRDNMAILKDGSFRAVVACQSINFDLMSSREREGVEYSYQNFLNSLYFPIQIFIRSQRVDIGPYLDRLVGIRQRQDNMLLNVLMDDYINFIDVLAQEANIMDKSFFIVVPYFPQGDLNSLKEHAGGFFKKVFGGDKGNENITIDQATYDKAKDEIRNRVSAVSSGLFQMGVKSKQLDTNELAKLYYNVYNPETSHRQPLVDFGNMATTFVRKGEGDAIQAGRDQ